MARLLRKGVSHSQSTHHEVFERHSVGFYLLSHCRSTRYVPVKLAQSQKRFSPAPFTTGTPLADALFLLANRAILPETVFRNLSHTWTKLPQSYFGDILTAQVPLLLY